MAEVLTEESIHKKTPQELTNLLYKALIDNLERAIKLINKNRIIEANRLLQNSNDILYRLGAGLNYEAGIVADQLEALYNYMAERLVEANRSKSVEIIGEVLTLTKEISDAWQTAQESIKDGNAMNGTIKKKVFNYDQDFNFDTNVDIKE